MNPQRLQHIMITLIAMLAATWPFSVYARDFSVESFRELPNDISAFINPVKDLNDEGCALLKVIAASPDYAFSTPLGIAKRIDNTGEIWLYIPRGSKKVTVKHPQWGVLRDYEFPNRLESHKTYELVIREPESPRRHIDVEPTVLTLRDTLVVTRTDTLVIKPEKPKIPLAADVLATFTYGGRGGFPMAGIMAAVMTRNGAFIHASTTFSKIGAVAGSCDRNGNIDGEPRFYSGSTRKSAWILTAGAIHRIGPRFAIFEGIGYGDCATAWQLAPSEGGGYVRNSYLSNKGVAGEVGLMLHLGHVDIVASALTVGGKEWMGSIGVGIRLGKNLKKRTVK